MRFFTTASATLALLAASVLGTPTPLRAIETFAGETVPGSFIVTLKDGVSKSALVAKLGSAVTHQWDTALNGFAGQL